MWSTSSQALAGWGRASLVSGRCRTPTNGHLSSNTYHRHMNEPTKLMSQNEWNDLCSATSQAMTGYVPKFMTPISRVISCDEGELEGTGSFLAIDGTTFLLTNEHVAAALKRQPLAVKFCGNDQFFVLRSDFAVITAPTDAAIARVDMSGAASATPVPLSLCANHHQPAEGELLFIAGYPGQRSKFMYKTLFSPLTPYLTQEDLAQTAVLDIHYFAVPWLPDRAWSLDERSPGLSLPPGMSGSLVWNTRRVEFLRSHRHWSPEDARVTGMVFGWSACANWVYATKVEHLRSAFPQLIQVLACQSS